jgi:ABC-type phosphate/phosphonate transport system ATPase subunit
MQSQLIGRANEKAVLLEALDSNEAEMVSVIGRRRVGKTFLVRTVYQDAICFELEGIQNAPRKVQLKDFAVRLNRKLPTDQKIKTPSSWMDAFYILK